MKCIRCVLMAGFLVACSSFNAFAADAANGQTVFNDACASCHSGGIKGFMSGAPSIKKKGKWVDYLSKEVATLESNIINGTDKHEPMGDCKACSIDDIKDAISYIISKAK